MCKNIFLLMFLLLSVHSYANENVQMLKAEADSAYVQEKYEQAAELYSQIAENGYDATLCYNLGCTYYRLNELAKSILWLERAILLEPDDNDIRYNLGLVRAKTIDRITPRHEMFFFPLYRSIVNMLSLHKWAIVALTCFVLFLVALSFYFFTNKIALRKVGFFSSFVFFLLVVFANIFAFQQRSYSEHRTKGVIMTTSVNVKSTPSESGNELFVIHEGTCFDIEDDTMKEWAQIRIADGKVGWIEKKTFERI